MLIHSFPQGGIAFFVAKVCIVDAMLTSKENTVTLFVGVKKPKRMRLMLFGKSKLLDSIFESVLTIASTVSKLVVSPSLLAALAIAMSYSFS